jgi:hypothetical protein
MQNKNFNDLKPTEPVGNDIIEVQPSSDTISGNDNQKPLSRFKQQRMKEKHRKEMRKMKQSVDNHKPLRVPKSSVEQKKGLNLSKAFWQDVKDLDTIVTNTINGFNQIAVQTIGIPTFGGVELTEEGKEIITTKSNLVFNDVENLINRKNQIYGPVSAKVGRVSENDLPEFLAVYEELLNLNQDVVNVLTEPCALLNEMLVIVHNKIEEAKSNQPTEKKDE